MSSVMIDRLLTETPVAYQGVPGAYSEEALIGAFAGARPVSCRVLGDVFAAIDNGDVEYGFIPVENSHAGTVAEAYDLILEHPVSVLAERIHPVRHYLLGVPGAKVADVQRVFSHPQALAQAMTYIRNAGMETEPYYDTAGAAKMVAERGDPYCAAVASCLAAQRYGLDVLAENIQTASTNATRFFLLGRGRWKREQRAEEQGPGKTSLVFFTEHRPGALVEALNCFARQGVNLAYLESRPSRQKSWEYGFFADIQGYEHEPPVHTSVEELSRLLPFVQVLGSYSAGANQ